MGRYEGDEVVLLWVYDGEVVKKSDMVECSTSSLNAPVIILSIFVWTTIRRWRKGNPIPWEVFRYHGRPFNGRVVDMTILHPFFTTVSFWSPAVRRYWFLRGRPKLEKLHLESKSCVFSNVRDNLTPEYLNIFKFTPNLRTFSYTDCSIQNWMSMLPSFARVMSRSVIEPSASSPSLVWNYRCFAPTFPLHTGLVPATPRDGLPLHWGYIPYVGPLHLHHRITADGCVSTAGLFQQ
ncbi:uncharacterized protein ARMOST_16054 [Armillaria ostoyae]|uniref:Uncharacterized protein n=1 Tax=Armillaria ostoyae TaxID=47428 RepID=A0A284RV81_ARMOS|nr:uncharacterized protein ARMOST_16054 [Armillaria ostoyae]